MWPLGELMSAKTQEVAALSASIEAKLEKVAELGVSIAQMKNDLGDTEEALLADLRGNHLSNSTGPTQVIFNRGESLM